MTGTPAAGKAGVGTVGAAWASGGHSSDRYKPSPASDLAACKDSGITVRPPQSPASTRKDLQNQETSC